MTFVRLADVEEFTAHNVGDTFWQKYDPDTKKFDKSPSPKEGYDEKFNVETDKGIMTISKYQMSQMLVSYHSNGKSDVCGKSFSVRVSKIEKDGQTRVSYWINPATKTPVEKKDERATVDDLNFD